MIDLPRNLKDGDMLVYQAGKFVKINVAELLGDLSRNVTELTDKIKVLESKVKSQQNNNAKFIGDLREVYKL